LPHRGPAGTPGWGAGTDPHVQAQLLPSHHVERGEWVLIELGLELGGTSLPQCREDIELDGELVGFPQAGVEDDTVGIECDAHLETGSQHAHHLSPPMSPHLSTMCHAIHEHGMLGDLGTCRCCIVSILVPHGERVDAILQLVAVGVTSANISSSY
jgi:hypothetical protein